MPPAEKKADEAKVEAAAEVEAAAPAADAAPDAPAADAAPEPAAPDIPHGVAAMRHPDPGNGPAGASFAGVTYEPDKDGFIVVPLAAVEPLKSHGFELVKKG